MRTGKTTRPDAASLPFDAAAYLSDSAGIAAYLEEMLADGDPRTVPLALRTVTDAVGGVGKLAAKTGLRRETLYRTLSSRGNPRLDTLCTILAVYGLRFSVQPAAVQPTRARKAVKARQRAPVSPSTRRSTRV